MCDPCKAATDSVVALRKIHPHLVGAPVQHSPLLCRDHGRPGCGCQHGQPRRPS